MEASSNSQLTREDPKFCCSAKGSAQGAAAGGGGGARGGGRLSGAHVLGPLLLTSAKLFLHLLPASKCQSMEKGRHPSAGKRFCKL